MQHRIQNVHKTLHILPSLDTISHSRDGEKHQGVIFKNTTHISSSFKDDVNQRLQNKLEGKGDCNKDVWLYPFRCLSLQRQDMKNSLQQNFKALIGCNQINAAGKTDWADEQVSHQH